MNCQSYDGNNEKYDLEDRSRMSWWQDARFGLFIHWGLYSIPAGEWDDNINHAEWIRTTAQIPIEQYDQFVDEFNPVRFDANEWVLMAKNAGMKYIVITSKHHDGFCLFDSKYTDYDIMATPFNRDVLSELANACRKHGLKLCFYYSIMDWHHYDYLPRRNWEDRSAIGTNYEHYIIYMKNQLKELIQNYGDIGVLWFDGEWEGTWNHTYGEDLYNYVRGLQPSIIINNRVDTGRSGMQGLTREGGYVGDFGTPEQEIPSTGLPDIDWETCMTMNDHWGYNKNDNNWKSTKELIQKLADIASKGGNFLLNVGPTSAGLFPLYSMNRLEDIGKWMKINGEAIYQTGASPFKHLSWGRCTQKIIKNGTRLYLHVFSWPQNKRLVVPGIYNDPDRAYLLTDQKSELKTFREDDGIVINIPSSPPDLNNSVVVLDLVGKPDVNDPPIIIGEQNIFIDTINVSITTDRENIAIHYTVDGSVPDIDSPIVKGKVLISETCLITALSFRDGQPVSTIIQKEFTKVMPYPGLDVKGIANGIRYKYYEGSWDKLPDFEQLEAVEDGFSSNFDISIRKRNDYFSFKFEGLILVSVKGVYSFFTDSDDGSRLYIGDQLVVDNDGLHGMNEAFGSIALDIGYHRIRVEYFEKGGNNSLMVNYKVNTFKKQSVPEDILFHIE